MIEIKLMKQTSYPAENGRLTIICENLEDIYETIEKVGDGTFASVFKVRKVGDSKNQYYAMKKLMVNPLADEISELDQLRKLKGDHIVQFYGYHLEMSELSLVMKYCKGSLRELMKKKHQIFTEQKILNLLTQITSSMLDLSCHGVMHLDLKPENILFENENYFKICDFGCSRQINCLSKNISKAPVVLGDFQFGTPLYTAPEILLTQQKTGTHRNSYDVWSMGVILYEIIYEKFPFKIDTSTKTYDFKELLAFKEDKKKINYDNSKFPKLTHLLKIMLTSSNLSRSSWKDIKKKLIESYQREEAEFVPVREACKSLMKMSLIFFNIVINIEDNLKHNTHQFWRSNSQLLKEICFNVCAYNTQMIGKFEDLFSSKYQKLSSRIKGELHFFANNAKTEFSRKLKQGKFAENPEHFQNEPQSRDNLLVLLKELRPLIDQNSRQWESIQKMANFCDESLQVGGYFCQGHRFVKTLKSFDLEKHI